MSPEAKSTEELPPPVDEPNLELATAQQQQDNSQVSVVIKVATPNTFTQRCYQHMKVKITVLKQKKIV